MGELSAQNLLDSKSKRAKPRLARVLAGLAIRLSAKRSADVLAQGFLHLLTIGGSIETWRHTRTKEEKASDS